MCKRMQNDEPVTVKICPYKEKDKQHRIPLAIAEIRKHQLHGWEKRQCLLSFFICSVGGTCTACRSYTKGECQGCRVNMEVKR